MDERKSSREDPFLEPVSSGERLACESLVGLSIGDALGAGFEGWDFDSSRVEMEPEPDRLLRWTDDTQMALSIVDGLLSDGTIDQDRLAAAFGRRFEPWRGYGRGMYVILPAIRNGKDWRVLKEKVFHGGSYGNGSAMRVAPLGAYFHDASVGKVVEEAERSAEVTHAHPEGLAGAAATAIAAWLAARSRGGPGGPLSDLYAAVREPLDPSLDVYRGIEAAEHLSVDAELKEAVARLGNGSKVSCADTVPLALWIAFQYLDDFNTAIRHAIAAGGDTDTLAAIVGGVVAARIGIESIPLEWRRAVESVPVRL